MPDCYHDLHFSDPGTTVILQHRQTRTPTMKTVVAALAMGRARKRREGRRRENRGKRRKREQRKKRKKRSPNQLKQWWVKSNE